MLELTRSIETLNLCNDPQYCKFFEMRMPLHRRGNRALAPVRPPETPRLERLNFLFNRQDFSPGLQALAMGWHFENLLEAASD
jgi:hypothetical protein